MSSARNQPTPSGLLAALANTKESLEMGPAGKLISATDPIPDDAYQLLSELTRSRPIPRSWPDSSSTRISSASSRTQVRRRPRRPTVIDAAQRRDLAALISNKTLIAAVQDPAFAEQLAKVDLRAAMNFALEKPSPSPAPSPTTATKKK